MLLNKVIYLIFIFCVSSGSIFAEVPLRNPFKPVSLSSLSTANVQKEMMIDMRPSMLMVKGVIWDDKSPVVMLSYKSRNFVLEKGDTFFGRKIWNIFKESVVVGLEEDSQVKGKTVLVGGMQTL